MGPSSANGVSKLRNISLAIFTSTRADYGVLSPLIELLRSDPSFDVRLIVTGTHLLEEFGSTNTEIESHRNIKIEKISSIDFDTDQPERLARYFAQITDQVTKVLHTEKIAYLVLIGDRIELLPAVLAATISQVPIIHLYGGELTHGAIDDAIRHATTKLSHIHFTSCEKYRNRVISLGENPSFVFNVGALFVDNFNNMRWLDVGHLQDQFNFVFDSKTFLVTFHSETMEPKNTVANLQTVLDAIHDLSKDFTFFFTLGNNDQLGRLFNQKILNFVKMFGSDRVGVSPSMGKTAYLSALRLVAGTIGNSSSGIIEAPYFDIATVNIGTRQAGREMPSSVLSVCVDKSQIIEAVKFSQTTYFLKSIINSERIFGQGKSAQKIVDILKSIAGKRNMKIFYEV